MANRLQNLSRRRFLAAGLAGGAGLTLGLTLPAVAKMGEAGPGLAGRDAAASALSPNAFVRIGSDDRVTVVAKHLEMGQGSHTGLATLLADELDARWSQVEVVAAPADVERYNNLLWGPSQGTGGSTAIANAFEQMRRAGAAARAMLVAAAAARWQVAADTLTVRDGVVSDPASGRRASFGELAEAAAALPVPDDVTLKKPGQFRLIGHDVPRKDIAAKTDGSALFTQDVERPGMLVAVVAHPPRFGAKLRGFDDSAARRVPGVHGAVQIPSGVAVLAAHTWAALKGRDALSVDWDDSAAMQTGSAELFADYAQRLERSGAVARNDGDADTALAGSDAVLSTDYRFPFLAHAAMEPMNCVIERHADGSVELWYGAQIQTIDHAVVAEVLGVEPGQVRINTLFAGGSFGRRANPASDYVREAAEILKATAGNAPIKLVWSREDDTRAGWYRPAYMHRIEAVLGDDGMPRAWRNRIVGQSIVAGTAFEGALVKDGVDVTSVEGAANLPYAIPNLRVELHTTDLAVPIQWWRAVGSTHTAFATETFVDRLARAAGADPVDYRRRLLKDHPRHLGVLDLAVAQSRWGQPLAEGRARGVAVHESFNSFVAMVAEVTVNADNRFSVDRVDVAVDCGIAVNPDIVRAQMEGGLGFGLCAVLGSAITIDNGAAVEANFDTYRVLRAAQMPDVRVHIVLSAAAPTGVGEPATPVIGPAVANALSSLTGKVYAQLPIRAA
ncbi:MAG: xanthine dehydrogenase family protein molybdopterin-binding subunit [Gammaproteobacteria bacterium]|nr:xanthine dehydrogenase family protein molybdopterin-binding subunit [Gammaproteobacteria bacterium]